MQEGAGLVKGAHRPITNLGQVLSRTRQGVLAARWAGPGRPLDGPAIDVLSVPGREVAMDLYVAPRLLPGPQD